MPGGSKYCTYAMVQLYSKLAWCKVAKELAKLNEMSIGVIVFSYVR